MGYTDAAKNVADKVGRADQDRQSAWNEFDDSEETGNDSDTDYADRAENAGHDVANAAREFGLGDVANKIDQIAGRLDGPVKDPPTCKIFFGSPSMLEGLEKQGEEMLGDALGGMGAFGAAAGAVASRVETYTVDSDKGASVTWTIYRVHMQEWLSRPWRCEVTLVATSVQATPPAADTPLTGMATGIMGMVNNPSSIGAAALGAAKNLAGIDQPTSPMETAPEIGIPIDPTLFLNSMVSLSWSRRNDPTSEPVVQRWVTGIISEFQDLGDTTNSTATATAERYVTLTVVPELWLLSLRKDCRIFQDMNALDIIREVLNTANVYQGATSMLPSVLAKLTDHVHLIPPKTPGSAADSADRISNSAWTPKREMCVQYNETDLDFVHRLLEEEGISYFFEHAKQDERLILVDNPTQGVYCQTVDGRSVPLMRPIQVPQSIKEGVWNFGMRQQLVPNSITLRDQNWDDPAMLRPTVSWAESADGSSAPQIPDQQFVKPRDYTLQPPLGTASTPDSPKRYPQYLYPKPLQYPYTDTEYQRYDPKASGDPAAVLLDSFRTQEELGRGDSNVTTMQAGRMLKFKGYQFYRNTDADVVKKHYENCLVTYSEHFLENTTAVTHAPPTSTLAYAAPEHEKDLGKLAYWNHFECLILNRDHPDAYPYIFRPQQVTPRPKILGVQTAVVVDDSNHFGDGLSDQVKIDDNYQRVKLHFHWDRRGDDLISIRKSSCWVRVAHSWAGHSGNGQWGTMFVPRAGMEVVVGFLEGNPDRPVVIGCVYNGHRIPPVVAPPQALVKNGADEDQPVVTGDKEIDSSTQEVSHATQRPRTIIKSQTEPFVDNSHANWIVFDDTKKSELVHVRAQKNLFQEVLHDFIVQVGQDTNEYEDPPFQVNAVKGTQSEQITGKKVLTVGGNRVKAVFGQETTTIGGDRRHTVGDPEGAAKDAAANAAPPAAGAASPAPAPAAPASTTPGNEKIAVEKDRNETVDGWELFTVGKEPEDPAELAKITRTLTVNGNQVVGIKKGENDGNKGDDTLTVLNVATAPIAKSDTIKGKFTISAGGGMNVQSGDPDPGGSGVSTDPDGSIDVHSNKDVKLTAVGKIDIKSDNNVVQFECDSKINIAAKNTSSLQFIAPGGATPAGSGGDPSAAAPAASGSPGDAALVLAGSGAGTGDIKGLRLSVNDGKTKVEITADGITFTVDGSPDPSVMKFSAKGIELSGNWLRMRASTSITMAGPINFKPGS